MKSVLIFIMRWVDFVVLNCAGTLGPDIQFRERGETEPTQPTPRVILRTPECPFVMYHGFGVEMQISTNHGAFTGTPPKCVARGVLDLAT